MCKQINGQFNHVLTIVRKNLSLMKLWIKISIIYVPRDCPHKIKIVCSGKVENYVTVRTQACVLWPLNVLCDLDLCGMDPGQGQCTLSQWGQHLYQVRAWTRNVTDGQTDEVQSYNALPNPWRGINKIGSPAPDWGVCIWKTKETK